MDGTDFSAGGDLRQGEVGKTNSEDDKGCSSPMTVSKHTTTAPNSASSVLVGGESNPLGDNFSRGETYNGYILSGQVPFHAIDVADGCSNAEEAVAKYSSIFMTRSQYEEMYQNSVQESSIVYLEDTYKLKRTDTPKLMEEAYYDMKHRRRGKALIFNNEKFDSQGTRTGSSIDRDKLHKQLKRLTFEVVVHNNKKLSEIRKILKEVSLEDHSDADCLVVVVMSHGTSGMIHAKDEPFLMQEIWLPFTEDNCHSLAGKPKMFFIQACRGNQTDSGVEIQCRTQHDAGSPHFKIPEQPNFFVAYSTVDGYCSWRNQKKGSWFLQAFCSELKQNGKLHDLLKLMTSTIRRVAMDFKSSTNQNQILNEMMQVPTFHTTLTRHVLFNTKG